jgi:competence protein ComGC
MFRDSLSKRNGNKSNSRKAKTFLFIVFLLIILISVMYLILDPLLGKKISYLLNPNLVLEEQDDGTRSDVATLAVTANRYYLDHNSLPQSVEDLKSYYYTTTHLEKLKYERLTDFEYKICAEYKLPSKTSSHFIKEVSATFPVIPDPYQDYVYEKIRIHPKGYHCIILEISEEID